MTSLISWIAIDRGPGSIYLASDSKLSWPSTATWRGGRKLFACRNHPALFGYCGDVLAPTQILSQLVDIIDAGVVGFDGLNTDERVTAVSDIIANALQDYPPGERRSVQILFAHRLGEFMPSTFHLHRLVYDGTKVMSRTDIPTALPRSALIAKMGSGAAAFDVHLQKWAATPAGGTSRSVFSALSDSLRAGEDPASGPPPQLVGIYRKGPARTFGVIWEGRRYFYGTELKAEVSTQSVKWHNDLFEICDPNSLERALDAQPQPRPEELNHA